MRVVLIGGSVFIGAAVVERLLALGHEVAVLNRGKSPASLPDGVRHIVGDRDALGDSRGEIASFAPDVVLHNVVITEAHARHAVEQLSGVVGRLVMTSSCDVYQVYGRLTGTEPGPPLEVPIHEDSPLRTVLYPYRERAPDPAHPLHDYDKIPAEAAVLGSDTIAGTVVRLPMVLGPNDYQHRLYTIIKPMVDGRPALVLDERAASWRSTYGFVENVAHAMSLAAVDERAAGRVYNIGDWSLSNRELIEAVGKELDYEGEIVVGSSEELPEELRGEPELIHDLVCTDARIRDELGYREPVDLPTAIARTVAWERTHPPEPLPDLHYEAVDRYLSDR